MSTSLKWIIGGVIAIIIIGAIMFFVTQDASDATQDTTTKTASDTVSSPQASSKSSDQVTLKSIGFNLGMYDPATKTAGDLKFIKLTQPNSEIWVDFGIQDFRSPNDPTKRNVQPTFILPLGTKVLSLVDGKVTNVEKLYSNDYTIMVQAEGSELIFETEHVNSPLVKVGDTVTGGQVIAEVSTHDSQYHPGYGILEIGILKGGTPPQHLCPFQYLDASIKEDTFAKIKALYKGWEDYRGKTTIYDEANYPIPGCATLEPAAG